MKIPHPLLNYEKPTLLLIMDSRRAELYCAHERRVEFIKKLESDPLSFEALGRQKVNLKGNPDVGVISAVTDEHLKDRERGNFFTVVAKELWKRYQNNEFEEIVLVLPREYEDKFRQCLRPELEHQITDIVSAILTKRRLPDILDRIDSMKQKVVSSF